MLASLASILFLFLALLAVVVILIIYRPPLWLILCLQRLWPDILFLVPTRQQLLALTIDDGPTHSTSELDQILRANRARATFFLIGSRIPGHQDVLHRLLLAGSEFANHAMHDEPSRSLSTTQLVTQISNVEASITEVYNSVVSPQPPPPPPPPPRYFRPGSGFFSSSMRHTIRNLKYRLVLGSVYPHDPQIRMARLNAWHILSAAHPGAIVVCHDRPWTPNMLRIVLPELRQRGYRIVTVTELLHHKGAD